MLVARDNRKVRIEVGKGLEETLTDLLAGRIIDYIIIPEFKNGDYDAGITKAIDSIIDIVKGKFDANSLKPQKSAPDYAAFMWIAFIVMSFISAFRRLLSGILGAIVLPIIGAFFWIHFICTYLTGHNWVYCWHNPFINEIWRWGFFKRWVFFWWWIFIKRWL